MGVTIERTGFNGMTMPEIMTGTAYMEEALAHTYIITPPEGVTYTGKVLAHVLRADDTAIAVDGTIDAQGRAVVTLIADCYHVAGRLQVAIYLTASDDSGVPSECIYACVTAIYRTIGSVELDSGTTIPTLAQMEAAYQDCVRATGNANTAASEARAASAVSVRYDTAQTLSATQQAQARENIGAGVPVSGDAIALDLSDSVGAYTTGNVGAQIDYKTSSVTTTYKNAAWVCKGCDYVLSITNSETPAATSARTGRIVGIDGTVLQIIDIATSAGATNDIAFTASMDGLFCPSVDANVVSLSMIGGPLYGVVKYNTAQTLSASQQKTARGNIGAADEADERGRDGLITYRTEAFDLEEVPGATNATCIGAESIGEIVRLNGTNNTSASVYIRLTGPGTRTASASTVRGWTGALTIPSGRVCRMTMRLLSGTVDGAVSVSVYKSGTSSTIGNAMGSNSLYERTWVSDGEAVSVAVWIASGTTLTDAVYSITIEDITSGQFGLSVAVDGTTPTITAAPGIRYECGTVNELTFTPSASGLCEVVFTTGSNPTEPVLPSTVRMPDWWTGVEANRTYDLMILNGTLAGVMSWAT
jgi:hypothetical protein